jgi:hypothetical protein
MSNYAIYTQDFLLEDILSLPPSTNNAFRGKRQRETLVVAFLLVCGRIKRPLNVSTPIG